MLITSTAALAEFCKRAAQHPYVTLDTEFLRERTYFAKLCLVQIGYPGLEADQVALVDPLADGISLDPLVELFENQSVVKVFHAARQDLEIFWHDLKCFPTPFFDTQIAAMVCGFGDQVGYETLVRQLAQAQMDKSSRFTDWSQRPLSQKQMDYAANDVTYLREIYETLSERLAKESRYDWVEEEMAALTDPELYDIAPERAWQRVRMRNSSPKVVAAVMTLAKFRESYAQSKNIPRARVFKDDALMELAATRPKTDKEFNRLRLLTREARGGAIAEGIKEALLAANDIPADAIPKPDRKPDSSKSSEAIADMLRVLLKSVSEREKVATKLIANTSELDAIARGDRDVPSLKGWRRKVFGDSALRLTQGGTALTVKQGRVELVDLND
ncbi:MAG: ribonuclease D [Pseudomonadota bacterium]